MGQACRRWGRGVGADGHALSGLRASVHTAVAVALAAAAIGCEPTVIVGVRVLGDAGSAADAPADADRDLDAKDGEAGVCLQAPASVSAVADAGAVATAATEAIRLPWSTGFEDGFCDYAPPTGFCYATGSASYKLVTSPVHSGHYAAAFSVDIVDGGAAQVRCVQEGVFPTAAYYSVWYYVPALVENTGVWNLVHFQGGDAGQALHGLWDVSLINSSDGGLTTTLYKFPLPEAGGIAIAGPAIPIGQWFHVEIYFKRANNNTGDLSMYQDGVLAVSHPGVETDDTHWGQWYVGNLATALLPPVSTVYVDDVSIRANF
jgi:hypothetical protein